MIKMKLTAAMTFLVILATKASFAAGVDLPPDSIGADTVFVIHANAEHLSPGLLRTAAGVVLGENAELRQ